MSYTITPKQYVENNYGARQRRGEIEVRVNDDTGPLVQSVMYDNIKQDFLIWAEHAQFPSTAWLYVNYPHTRPEQEQLRNVWEWALTLVDEDLNREQYDDDRLHVHFFEGDLRIYIGLSSEEKRAIAFGANNVGEQVALITRSDGKTCVAHSFRPGRWLAYMEQRAAEIAVKQAEESLRLNDTVARKQAEGFAPIDDAALFAEPVEAVLS